MPVPLFLALSRRWAQEQERQDRRTALVCYTMACMWGKKKDGSEWRLEDFMPQKPETDEEKIMRLEAVMMAMVEKNAG